MKIKLVVILILLGSMSTVFSQGFKGGLMGGLNAARIDNDGFERYGKLGLNAGAFVSRDILPNMLEWQLEVKYTSRGMYNIQRDLYGNVEGVTLMDLRYVEFPLSIQFLYNEKIQVELGLSPDLLLKEYYERDYIEISADEANDLNKVGVTAFVGLNYFVLKSLALGVRFNYSLLPIYKFPGTAIRYFNSGWFHDVLSVNARYYFVGK